MSGRLLALVFALTWAVPATAGERAVAYAPAPDAIALLMQDERATFASPGAMGLLLQEDRVLYASRIAPQLLAGAAFSDFRVRADGITVVPVMADRVDLNGFDRLALSVPAYAPGPHSRRVLPEPGFVLPFEVVGPLGIAPIPVSNEVTSSDGGRFAVRDTLRRGRRVYRARALDAMVQFRLDGREDTPPLDVAGGVAAALWDAIPR